MSNRVYCTDCGDEIQRLRDHGCADYERVEQMSSLIDPCLDRRLDPHDTAYCNAWEIAEETPLSSRQVSQYLAKARRGDITIDGIDIDVWGNSTPHTWVVKSVDGASGKD